MFRLRFTGHFNQYIRIISVAVHFKLLIDQSMEVKSSWSLLCCDHHHITASSCDTYMFHFGRSFFHSGLHLLLWGHGEYWFAKCREFWLNGRLSLRIFKRNVRSRHSWDIVSWWIEQMWRRWWWWGVLTPLVPATLGCESQSLFLFWMIHTPAWDN